MMLRLVHIRLAGLLLAVLVASTGFILFAPQTHAAAPNGFTSKVYQDSNSDGTVDRVVVVINGGEALTACTVDATELGTDWTYTGNGIGGSIASATCDTGTATITFTLTGTTASVTGTASAPTIGYDNDDADNSIANASGNLGTVAAGDITDNAAPKILAAAYSDGSSDGTVDRVVFSVSADTGIVCTAYTPLTDLTINTAGTVNLVRNGSDTCSTNGTTNFRVNFATVGATNVTGGTTNPVVTYTQPGNGVEDGAGNDIATVNSLTATDGAAPRVLTATYLDNNADGEVDRLRFNTTADTGMVCTAYAGATALTINTPGTVTLANHASDSCASNGTSTFTITLTTVGATNTTGGGTAPVVTYTQPGNGLEDGAGNDLSTASSVTVADGAGPVLITSSPTNGAANVQQTATITLTFSEAVSSITTSINPSVTLTNTTSLPSATVVFTSTKASGTNTLTVNTAPDATANALAGASGAVNPFTFTVLASSSGSSSSSSTTTESYAVTLNSHNTDSTSVTVGESSTITWGSTGSAMTYVDLYLSVDGGTTWSTIVTNTPNDGSYVWTVPDEVTTQAKIRVDGTDLATVLATDSSDASFSITTEETPNDDSIVTDEPTESETDSPAAEETGISPVTGEVEAISHVEAGDYIRGAYFDTVYYIDADMVRHPFMDRQTFFTYETNFDGVITVTDATLTTLTLGTPMLPKAGVVLVKIESDNRVYWVEGDLGTGMYLRWIASEGVAKEMFGEAWADYVIDVSSAIFPKYAGYGTDVDTAFSVDEDMLRTRDEVNTAQ